MSWWRRRGAGAASGSRAELRDEAYRVRDHLEAFVRSRPGVEAYIEPATTMNPPTVVLIASTGEWTRRKLPGPGMIKELAERMHVPVYDVQLVGYPQRMRDWNERAKRGEAQPSADPLSLDHLDHRED